jgi:hypothetical protein
MYVRRQSSWSGSWKRRSSVLKTEAACSSEIVISIYQTTRFQIPQDSDLQETALFIWWPSVCEIKEIPIHNCQTPMIPRGCQVNSTRRQFFNTRYEGIRSQRHKVPVLQYKVQGATKPTVQYASSSIQDTRGYQVNSTRSQFFNTRYKGIRS